jgi:small-conductance mechanosensitive channel
MVIDWTAVIQITVDVVLALVVINELFVKKRRAKTQDLLDEWAIMEKAQAEQRQRVADAQLDAQRAMTRASEAETRAAQSDLKFAEYKMETGVRITALSNQIEALEQANKNKDRVISRFRTRIKDMESRLKELGHPVPPEEEEDDKEPTTQMDNPIPADA